MQLSVQEIIAKVAIQRQKEKQAYKQQQLLKQISKKSTANKSQNPNPQKYSTKPEKFHQNDTSTLSKKYQNLNQIYKKLKTQLTTELKMDKKHNELIERLTKVIEQNSKLQNELDCLRTKRSVIEYNEKSLNSSQNERRNRSKKFAEKNERSKRSMHEIDRSSVCCQCQERKVKQNSYTEAYEGERLNKQIIQQQKLSEIKHHIHPQTKESCPLQKNSNIDTQINQYKQMIASKQFSINKLKSMLQKQNELIESYENQFTKQQVKNQDQLPLKGIERKVEAKESRKVEGTIVKVKRQKHSPTVEAEMRNKTMTDRSASMFPPSQFNFLSPPYMQANDQRTKKKQELISNRNNLPDGIIESNKSPGYINNLTNYQYQYIESFPSQEEKSRYNPHYYQPYYHSPASSINETSEFVCGELE